MSEVEVTETDQGVEYWATRPYLKPDTQKQLRRAAVLVVPREKFRERDVRTFPVQTEDLVAFLRERLGPDAPIAVAIEDEDFKELALHSGLIELGSFVLTGVGAIAGATVVKIIADYLGKRIANWVDGDKQKAEVRVDFTVKEQAGPGAKTVKLTYDGPVESFLPAMEQAVKASENQVAGGEEKVDAVD